jgi:hypothetical protein
LNLHETKMADFFTKLDTYVEEYRL